MPRTPARQPTEHPKDTRVIAQVARVLSGQAYATGRAVANAIGRALAPLRLTTEAVSAAIRLAAKASLGRLPTRQPILTATEIIARSATTYRARYLVSAARRLHTRITARPAGETLTTALNAGLRTERRYLARHLVAQKNRAATARQIDALATIHGDRLGWYATLDDRVTPECRAAAGHDFLASDPPAIGLPGTVHGSCRCKPGPPWGTALLP